MTIFQSIFGKNKSHKTKRDYPTLKMVNPDLVVMDMKAFRASKKAKEQAKAARESFYNQKNNVKA